MEGEAEPGVASWGCLGDRAEPARQVIGGGSAVVDGVEAADTVAAEGFRDGGEVALGRVAVAAGENGTSLAEADEAVGEGVVLVDGGEHGVRPVVGTLAVDAGDLVVAPLVRCGQRRCSSTAAPARPASARSVRSCCWIDSRRSAAASRAERRAAWVRRVSGRSCRRPPVLASWRPMRPSSSQARRASCSRRSTEDVYRAWDSDVSGGSAARTASCSARSARRRRSSTHGSSAAAKVRSGTRAVAARPARRASEDR